MFNLCHFGGYFNPRPPWGGRPIRPTPQDHMPCYFNPRPPWGGRPYFTELIDESSSFQSTPSVGRATKEKARIASAINRISIHALRGEGDRTRYITDTVIENFNPRPPWGGRLNCLVCFVQFLLISIHALRGEGDTFAPKSVIIKKIFQSTPSVGRATTGNSS